MFNYNSVLMKKEVSLAILAGGTLGLIIAFAAWKGNSLLKIKKGDTETGISQTSTPAKTNIPQNEPKTKIIQPDNLDVLTTTPIIISGITNPQNFIVLSTASNDVITTASDSGTFTASLDLDGGVNQIKIFSFNQDASSTNSNLNLVYSSQFTPKDSSQKPTSYIGTITDITTSTIQIKNDTGDVQQIQTTSDAAFIDTRGKTIKNLKLNEIAIGDYIAAMGYKDANNILSSSRIIVIDALKDLKIKAFMGQVTDVQNAKITVKNSKTNESVDITPNTSLQITGASRFSQIKVNDKIITIGEFKDNTIDARTIQVIK